MGLDQVVNGLSGDSWVLDNGELKKVSKGVIEDVVIEKAGGDFKADDSVKYTNRFFDLHAKEEKDGDTYVVNTNRGGISEGNVVEALRKVKTGITNYKTAFKVDTDSALYLVEKNGLYSTLNALIERTLGIDILLLNHETRVLLKYLCVLIVSIYILSHYGYLILTRIIIVAIGLNTGCKEPDMIYATKHIKLGSNVATSVNKQPDAKIYRYLKHLIKKNVTQLFGGTLIPSNLVEVQRVYSTSGSYDSTNIYLIQFKGLVVYRFFKIRFGKNRIGLKFYGPVSKDICNLMDALGVKLRSMIDNELAINSVVASREQEDKEVVGRSKSVHVEKIETLLDSSFRIKQTARLDDIDAGMQNIEPANRTSSQQLDVSLIRDSDTKLTDIEPLIKQNYTKEDQRSLEEVETNHHMTLLPAQPHYYINDLNELCITVNNEPLEIKDKYFTQLYIDLVYSKITTRFYDMLDNDTQWRIETQNDEYTTKISQDDVFVVRRTELKIRANIKNVYGVLTDLTKLAIYNQLITSATTTRAITEDASLEHVIIKVPFPLTTRDIAHISISRWVSDNKFIIGVTSAPETILPSVKKYVRSKFSSVY